MDTQIQFLVTAGNTREKIDEVRDWGNIFTGQTGRDIAVTLAELGNVLLLTSNAAHAAELSAYPGKGGRIVTQTFRHHHELLRLLQQAMQQPPAAVLMTAAVSDYAPAGAFQVVGIEKIPGSPLRRWIVQDVQAAKIKSTHGQIAILGSPTLKLIDQFRGPWGFRGLLVKFKLEAGITEDQLLTIARQSRLASGADLIVANTLEMVRGPAPAAYILGETLTERIGRGDLAARLRDHVAAHLKSATGTQ